MEGAWHTLWRWARALRNGLTLRVTLRLFSWTPAGLAPGDTAQLLPEKHPHTRPQPGSGSGTSRARREAAIHRGPEHIGGGRPPESGCDAGSRDGATGRPRSGGPGSHRDGLVLFAHRGNRSIDASLTAN